jgi:hypothetical protein
MAAGDVTVLGNGETCEVLVLDAATATNSPPSGASAGISVDLLGKFGSIPNAVGVKVWSTAGSGTMTVTIKLWGRSNTTWVPVGAGADTTKGEINVVAAIGETTADSLVHSEVMNYPGMFQRIYAEIVAIGGTSTAVSVALLVHRGY